MKTVPSQYQGSLYEQSLQRTQSTASTMTQRPTFVIPPIQVGQPLLTPPHSPKTASGSSATAAVDTVPPKQTPLQRHLAHLARHGIHGVSSAPGEALHDSNSSDSPRGSLVHVGSVNGTVPNAGYVYNTGASVNSVSGSIKGRLSRFGSLNFGRRGPQS